MNYEINAIIIVDQNVLFIKRSLLRVTVQSQKDNLSANALVRVLISRIIARFSDYFSSLVIFSLFSLPT